jgi:hypothetical protein
MTDNWYLAAERYANWLDRTADAEQAKSTGGMLALMPRSDFAEVLAVPGYEPPEDLHVTLFYFGEDVTDMPGEAEISQAAAGVAQQFPALVAKAFGHAVFNPNGEEPCAVYLIGNSQELDDLHRQLEQVVAPFCAHEQHVPWTPHVTAGYGLDPHQLGYDGDVIFDRISLQWAG